MLNIIFRDIHQFTLASHLEMLLTGFYNGTEITDTILLIGGFLVEIPIAMVLFSRLLKRKYSRPLNIIAAIMTTGVMLYTPPGDPDDWFFGIVELAAIAMIICTAYKWPKSEPEALAMA